MSREFTRWLDAEHYILFARAFGYAGEAVRETICDYEDYQRAACRCAVLCWDAGYFQVYCKDENVLEVLTPTRNCGRCATGLNMSPTKTTGGRRFVSEAIFPAPVLTGRALSAIIKHTVRQSHPCGAPHKRFSHCIQGISRVEAENAAVCQAVCVVMRSRHFGPGVFCMGKESVCRPEWR